jgi:hypothetical protein
VKTRSGGTGERRPRAKGTAAARARRGSAEFLSSFAALQEAVRVACASGRRWEEQIVAGIQAALRFAAAEPQMAHALIVQGRREPSGDGDREQEVIAYFASLLASVAPAELRRPTTTDEGVVEAIAALVRGHLQAGAAERLPAAAADLVYLALMPYLGLEGARSWAEMAEIPY